MAALMVLDDSQQLICRPIEFPSFPASESSPAFLDALGELIVALEDAGLIGSPQIDFLLLTLAMLVGRYPASDVALAAQAS